MVEERVKEFAYKTFYSNGWEEEVKSLISSIQCEDEYWYKLSEHHSIIDEELIPLGFYVKYKYGETKKVEFSIKNPTDTEIGIDGIIKFPDQNTQETVQITNASIDEVLNKEMEKLFDKKFGSIPHPSFSKIKERISKVVGKKLKMGVSADTLLVVTRKGFSEKVLKEYPKIRTEIISNFPPKSEIRSEFNRIVFVDYKPWGIGSFFEIEY